MLRMLGCAESFMYEQTCSRSVVQSNKQVCSPSLLHSNMFVCCRLTSFAAVFCFGGVCSEVHSRENAGDKSPGTPSSGTDKLSLHHSFHLCSSRLLHHNNLHLPHSSVDGGCCSVGTSVVRWSPCCPILVDQQAGLLRMVHQGAQRTTDAERSSGARLKLAQFERVDFFAVFGDF